MLRHPCFDEKAHREVGRLHLPVAPACNIKCRYCEPDFSCVHESRPGVTSSVLLPSGVVEYVERALTLEPRIEVIGIAGPGDALANKATFKALETVREHFPEKKICLATNGLALPQNVEQLASLGVEFISVTVNFVEPETGARVIKGVKTEGGLAGPEAARLLLERQLQGIQMAADAGIHIKINTVLIPGINDHEIDRIAMLASRAGASLMNILGLIPVGEFAGRRAPGSKEISMARSRAASYLPQFLSCKRCRADALGIPGKGDRSLEGMCAAKGGNLLCL